MCHDDGFERFAQRGLYCSRLPFFVTLLSEYRRSFWDGDYNRGDRFQLLTSPYFTLINVQYID